ncbi:MAG: hypothetical protein V3W18_04955 [candidate division Zixibacteria bacterium]
MASPTKKKVTGPDFSRNNYIVLGIGLFLVILGFIIMGTGDITISPILLVLGYCVAIPIGILLPAKKVDKSGSSARSDG